LGDLGGLAGAILTLSRVLLFIHQRFCYYDKLLFLLFVGRNKQAQDIEQDFRSRVPFQTLSFCARIKLVLSCKKSLAHFNKRFKRQKRKIKDEFDMLKLIKAHRLNVLGWRLVLHPH
jgi:hypothetical protein